MTIKRKSYMNRCRTRCLYCGRFIGEAEFDRDDIISEYKPAFSLVHEAIDHYHKRCYILPEQEKEEGNV